MKKIVITIMLIVMCNSLFGQNILSKNDLRYLEMREKGVWNVDLTMSLHSNLSHILPPENGSYKITYNTLPGYGIGVGYFVADNHRIGLEFSSVTNTLSQLSIKNENRNYGELSVHNLSLLGGYHIKRWAIDYGLNLAFSNYNYNYVDGSDGVYGMSSSDDYNAYLGVVVSGWWFAVPFVKLGVTYHSLFSDLTNDRFFYNHTFSIGVQIYLPLLSSLFE